MDDSKLQLHIGTDYDGKGVEAAEQGTSHLGDAFKQIGEIAAAIGLEKLTEQLVDFGKEALSAGLEAGASFEHANIALTTLIGNQNQASKLMQQLNDLSSGTAFSPEKYDQLAVSLLNMGVPLADIPTRLSQMANIAETTGTSVEDMSSKMDQMVQVFQMVNEAGGVNSMTLRLFQREGIPIIQSLVDYYNKFGGAITTTSAAMDAQGKKTQDLSLKHLELQDQLTNATNRLKNLEDEHVKAGHATDVHAAAVTAAQQKIEELNMKMGMLTTTTASSGQASTVTAEQVAQMATKGTISMDVFMKAWDMMGDRFKNGAKDNADTMDVQTERIKNRLADLTAAILGVDATGKVQKGGLFDTVQKDLTTLINYLDAHRKDIEEFGKALMNMLVPTAQFLIGTAIPAFGNLASWIEHNRIVIAALAGIVAGVLIIALIALGGWIAGIITMVIALGGTFGGIAALIGGVVVGALTLLMLNLQRVGDFFTAMGNTAIDVINAVAQLINNFVNGAIDAINMLFKALGKSSGLSHINLHVDYLKAPGSSVPAPNFSSGNVGFGSATGNSFTNNKNVTINNSNTFNNGTDISNFSQMQAWQITSR